jgi:TPR repeat protein
MYDEGNAGLPKRRDIAVQWWRKSASQHNGRGEYLLSLIVSHKSKSEGSALLLKGAQDGDHLAQMTLGYGYKNGFDLPQDYRKAAYWFQKSADQGDEEAQLALGEMYRDGLGVSRDYVQAYKWLTLSSRRRPADMLARMDRKELAHGMSKAQIDQAAQAVRDWKPFPSWYDAGASW